MSEASGGHTVLRVVFYAMRLALALDVETEVIDEDYVFLQSPSLAGCLDLETIRLQTVFMGLESSYVLEIGDFLECIGGAFPNESSEHNIIRTSGVSWETAPTGSADSAIKHRQWMTVTVAKGGECPQVLASKRVDRAHGTAHTLCCSCDNQTRPSWLMVSHKVNVEGVLRLAVDDEI
ncbi:hypothetical protein KCU85_g448, partial [Aureobasidium melanogenum]